MTKIKDVSSQIRGVSYQPNDLHDSLNENSVILLRANNINDDSLNFDDVVYVDKSKVSKIQYISAGDILVCASSGSKNLVGKATFVKEKINATFGAFCKVVRPKNVYPSYLGHYFTSPIYRETISSLSAGANINNIKNEHIDSLEIKIPNLEIQKKIAENLDKVSELISIRRKQLDKLDELVKSRFVEMFGDIYSNPQKYPICALSDFILFLTSGSRGWAKYCVDEGNEWFITIKNVKDCRISLDNMQQINAPNNIEAKRTRVEEGDLLISITADLGRTGVVTNEIAEHGAYINQHLTCIRLDRSQLVPIYVAYFMESESGKLQFDAKNQIGVKAGLNFDSIRSLKLLIPPLSLQERFVDFVDQTDKSKLVVNQSLEKLETLKKALMQKYFE